VFDFFHFRIGDIGEALVLWWSCILNKHQNQGFVKIPQGVEEPGDLFLLAVGGGNEGLGKWFMRLIFV